MMRDTEEIEIEFSYSAYLSDLRLMSKSFYSAAANPLLHLWLHSLGSLLLAERSLNAGYLSDTDFNGILANTLLLAFVRRRTTGFVMSFADTQEQAYAEGREMGKAETAISFERIHHQRS
ncbi:unnamed protein product [Ixodes persulcatus]